MAGLLTDPQLVSALIVALIGGGGIGGIVGAVSSRRKDTAEISKLAVESLSEDVIKPLREHVEYQQEQIDRLERVQGELFATRDYARRLYHWVRFIARKVDPDVLKDSPEPDLPDMLRESIAPETVSGGKRGRDP